MGRTTNPDVLRKRAKEKFENTYYTKIRNAGGQVLKLSAETKRAWRAVAKAQQKPTFLKRTESFIEFLKQDSLSTLANEKNWCKEWRTGDYYRHGFYIGKSRGGVTSSPKVIFVDSLPGAWGIYTKHILAGKHQIELSLYQKRELEEIKRTFRHEILHYIDDLSHTPHQGHGYYWTLRLDKLSSMLPLPNYKAISYTAP